MTSASEGSESILYVVFGCPLPLRVDFIMYIEAADGSMAVPSDDVLSIDTRVVSSRVGLFAPFRYRSSEQVLVFFPFSGP